MTRREAQEIAMTIYWAVPKCMGSFGYEQESQESCIRNRLGLPQKKKKNVIDLDSAVSQAIDTDSTREDNVHSDGPNQLSRDETDDTTETLLPLLLGRY
jgi:hypothetical protein